MTRAEEAREPLLPDHWIPRFVTERPRSLTDAWLYALEATYTAADSGSPWRWGHVLFTWLITTPLWTVAHGAIWASERPGRFFPLLAIGTLAATGLNQWPAIAWLVPDWWTWPYWYATVTGWWAT